MTLVVSDILTLKFAHFLDLVKVDNEALVISMLYLDALSAEYCPVIRAVEVLNALVVRHAQLLFACFYIIEINLTKQWIPFDYFIQYINVQWQSFRGLQVLDQFAADRATHSKVPKKRC